MKEVRTRLGNVKLKRGKWQSGRFGGPQLDARFSDFELSVLFYAGKAITTSFYVSTSSRSA
jgi:hypothetical protein